MTAVNISRIARNSSGHTANGRGSRTYKVRAWELKAAGMDWTKVLEAEIENKRARLDAGRWPAPPTSVLRRGSRRSWSGGGCRATLFHYGRRLGGGDPRSGERGQGMATWRRRLLCRRYLEFEAFPGRTCVKFPIAHIDYGTPRCTGFDGLLECGSIRFGFLSRGAHRPGCRGIMAKPVKVRRCRATVTRFDRCTPGQGSRSGIGREARSPASISCCDHLAKGGPDFAIPPFTARPESVSPASQLRDGYEWGPLESAPLGHRQPSRDSRQPVLRGRVFRSLF